MLKRLLIIIPLIILSSIANAQKLDGDYLYKVTTIRAGTGQFADLIDWVKAFKNSGYHEKAETGQPLVMRHSQGDQWDLLFITPMGSWQHYYSESVSTKRAKASAAYSDLLWQFDEMVAFEEDHFSYGPPYSVLSEAYLNNDFYHIEMFDAAPGKADALLEERHMENVYLAATGQVSNFIFRRAAGSNVDVFTIGFHQDIEAFSASSGATADDKEKAAKAAGFKDRADLSFYLRALLSAHHDTLAGKVE